MAKILCPIRGHPNGTSSMPHYSIKGDDVCPARGHSKGSSSVPEYLIKGNLNSMVKCNGTKSIPCVMPRTELKGDWSVCTHSPNPGTHGKCIPWDVR